MIPIQYFTIFSFSSFTLEINKHLYFERIKRKRNNKLKFKVIGLKFPFAVQNDSDEYGNGKFGTITPSGERLKLRLGSATPRHSRIQQRRF